MEFIRVAGKDAGPIRLYTLSTCGWCKKTKALLNELGLEYEYVDVDQLAGAETELAREHITRWNPNCSFPTLVIGEDRCIVGFKEDEIRELLAL
jgi:glutaredoxin